jgi:hypothetical protein
MNLPLVIDIAIGLVLIYLVLSLLASELQELIATLLQWRAKHLKESIEHLLSGGHDSPSLKAQVHSLTANIYNDPLLRNVNQESRGLISGALRAITWGISGFFQLIFRRKDDDFFGYHTGPSYIPSETFATSLLETIGIPKMVDKLVESRLESFSRKIIDGINRIAAQTGKNVNQYARLRRLQTDLYEAIQDYKNKQASLPICIDRFSELLDLYINSHLPLSASNSSEIAFLEQVKALKLGLFGIKNERAILSGGLQPTVAEIVEAINPKSRVHQEVQQAFGDRASEPYKAYENLRANLEQLPVPIRESLAALARRAQSRVKQEKNDLAQLREEVALWFDRAMSRTSGVYKRNAKGVAILIGLLLAIAANADTFHIVGRLASDENLRQVIVQRASQAPETSQPPSEVELELLREQTKDVLEDVSVPISWSPSNLRQQLGCMGSNPRGGNLTEWGKLYSQCLPGKPISEAGFSPPMLVQIALTHPFYAVRMLLGWGLTSIALAMGAPFWFDLMGKVINVRNTGSKPASLAAELEMGTRERPSS